MFPQLNVCCVLTVSVCLSSILASPSCQNCLFGECDQDGVCTEGCEPGFTDIFCQHPCQETCTKGRCVVDKHTGTTMCTDGCVDGFCYLACKIPCPEGCLRCKRMLCENCTLCESHSYGDSCQHSCLDKCKGYACSIQGNCSQDTCMGGRYGKLCSSSCKPRYESCDQVSGHCLKCRRGLFGDDCQYQCSQECLTREEEDMFRCRSGCKLCVKPLQPESKTELDYTDMEAKFNIIYGLCIALIVITLTILGFHIKNAWPWRCGRRENVEDFRKRKRPIKVLSNRSYVGEGGTPLLGELGEIRGQSSMQIQDGEQPSGQLQAGRDVHFADVALSGVQDGSNRSSQKSQDTPLLEKSSQQQLNEDVALSGVQDGSNRSSQKSQDTPLLEKSSQQQLNEDEALSGVQDGSDRSSQKSQDTPLLEKSSQQQLNEDEALSGVQDGSDRSSQKSQDTPLLEKSSQQQLNEGNHSSGGSEAVGNQQFQQNQETAPN